MTAIADIVVIITDMVVLNKAKLPVKVSDISDIVVLIKAKLPVKVCRLFSSPTLRDHGLRHGLMGSGTVTRRSRTVRRRRECGVRGRALAGAVIADRAPMASSTGGRQQRQPTR